jgi:Fe-S cluster biogenesis protein NfuA
MTVTNPDATLEVLLEALEEVRPYLQEDGGDVELVSVSSDGIVEIRFLGECATCSLAIMTLRAGIERSLMLACPDVKRIERVA